jgi:DNA-nicking Smr family endonuclease
VARKKKKRARGPTPKKEDGGASGFGTLANQVKSVRRELRADRREGGRALEPPAAPEPPPPKRRLTEAELMAESFDLLASAFSGVEKYTGRGHVADDVELISESLPAPTETSADGEVSGDDLLFLEAMATGVERIDAARDALQQKEWGGAAWRTEAQLAALTSAELKFLDLTPAHRELLKRSRAEAPIPVLNIRRYALREAMGEVDAFVRDCAAKRIRFARIVHGKGRESKGSAVLKPEVVRWCEGVGDSWVRGWAPEVDRSGQFGSLVIELRR